MTYLSAEIEIDASEIVSDAHSDIYSIAEEAIAEYDLTDRVDDAVESSLENRIAEEIDEWMLHNPARIMMAMEKAFSWANERQALVIDQAKELETKRRRIVELERELQELRQSTTTETKETDASGTRPEMS